MSSEKTLSPGQAARKLGVGLQRVYSLLYSGKLRATKQRNRWLIPESVITERLQWVEKFK